MRNKVKKKSKEKKTANYNDIKEEKLWKKEKINDIAVNKLCPILSEWHETLWYLVLVNTIQVIGSLQEQYKILDC